jgi:hypothetical protein
LSVLQRYGSDEGGGLSVPVPVSLSVLVAVPGPGVGGGAVGPGLSMHGLSDEVTCFVDHC